MLRIKRSGKPFVLDFPDLYSFNPELSFSLMSNPRKTLNDFSSGVDRAGVRVRGMIQQTPIRLMGSSMMGGLVSVRGIVVKASQDTSRVSNAVYRCSSSSCYPHVTTTVIQNTQFLTAPVDKCEECDERKWLFDPEASTYRDSQSISIQETPDQLPSGEIPRKLDVQLLDNLVKTCNPGDLVEITGIVNVRRQSPDSFKLDLERYLEANHVEVMNKQDEGMNLTEKERNEIIQISKDERVLQRFIHSVAPSIYGYNHIKEAILLQLFSSPAQQKADVRIRGDIAVLLCGEPGLSKSQLLKIAVSLSPRGVFTTAGRSTKAGLTAAAVKDEKTGGFMLEAGACVLADMALCISEDQLLVTPNGIITLKNNTPQKIISYDKGYKASSVRYQIDNGMRETVTVKTFDGSELCCTPDHKVLTNRGWIEAGNLTTKDCLVIPASYDPIHVTNQDEFELGFLYGFGLSDIYIGGTDNHMSFSASEKNQTRTDYIISLIEKHFKCPIGRAYTPAYNSMIRGHMAHFSNQIQVYFTSQKYKSGLRILFEMNQLPQDTSSFKIGFLSGIVSTDCNISHKKGKYGVKHIIEINLNREKYSEMWLKEKMFLVKSIFNSYGVYATIRGPQLQINSLYSYNRVVDLLRGHLSGRAADKLIPITPKRYISSYDCWLNNEYCDWFLSRKIYTTPLVKHTLASRYHAIKTKRIMTIYLVDIFRKYWSEMSDEPFREPNKDYLLNPIISVTPSGMKKVYDLNIEGEPNFLTIGGIVHNCAVDEIERMDKNDRAALHPVMEQQIVAISMAGISATLNARCAILGAGNPVAGRWNHYQTVSENINLPVSLLSRFDLIFIMIDTPDSDRDNSLAEKILGMDLDEAELLSREQMKKYIAYARTIAPEMPTEFKKRIRDFYVGLRRGSEATQAIMITPRQLESIPRLSKAVARVHLHEKVTESDLDEALRLFKRSMEDVGIDPETGKVDYDAITTGKTRNLQDKTMMFMNAIRRISQMSIDHRARVEDVKASLMAQGWSSDEYDRVEKMMNRDGVLFNPSAGYVAVVG